MQQGGRGEILTQRLLCDLGVNAGQQMPSMGMIKVLDLHGSKILIVKKKATKSLITRMQIYIII